MKPRPRGFLLAAVLGAVALVAGGPVTSSADLNGADPAAAAKTVTPIKHLVVIFQENVSFDHYFGTYPVAANPDGEPRFTARSDTPTVNGLDEALLTANPNKGNPERLDRGQALTCDQDHDYTPEQKAFDSGLMDRFVENTGTGPTLGARLVPAQAATPGNYAVMDYYDGNTVSALWNYAQHFAMSDNSYGTGFGPSTPGALEVVAGNTFGAISGLNTNLHNKPAAARDIAGGSAIGDGQPSEDVCSKRNSFFRSEE